MSVQIFVAVFTISISVHAYRTGLCLYLLHCLTMVLGIFREGAAAKIGLWRTFFQLKTELSARLFTITIILQNVDVIPEFFIFSELLMVHIIKLRNREEWVSPTGKGSGITQFSAKVKKETTSLAHSNSLTRNSSNSYPNIGQYKASARIFLW